ncbi:MAG: hypothetical protein LBQ60_07430 [Bacteroidales bacterium]|jgi:hypothetical protein|nr:hypothetical protein [Bacteroidales bacterium]
MKRITYDKLTEHLKNTPPVFEDPDVTSEAIMNKIAFMSRNRKKITIMRTVGWLSGAAAFLLIFLLIQEVIYPYQTEKTDHLIVQSIHEKDDGEKVTRKNKEIISSIIKDKLENTARKKQIYASLHIK